MLEQIKPNVSRTTLEIHKIKDTSRINSRRLLYTQFTWMSLYQHAGKQKIKRRYVRVLCNSEEKKIEQNHQIMWLIGFKTFKQLSLCEYEKNEKESNYRRQQIEGGRYVIEEQLSFFPKLFVCSQTSFRCSYFISAEWTYRPLSSGGIGTLRAEQD